MATAKQAAAVRLATAAKAAAPIKKPAPAPAKAPAPAPAKAPVKAPVKAPAPAPAKAPAKAPAPAPAKAPAIHPLLQQQIEAYENTGVKLTEQNKIAMARSMGVDYGGSNYYSGSQNKGQDSQYSYDIYGRAVAEGKGIGSTAENPGSSHGWGRW